MIHNRQISTHGSTQPCEITNTYSHHAGQVNFPRILTLLSTSRTLLQKSIGDSLIIRILIDQGSELSFIEEDLVRRAQLQRRAASIPLLGIGGMHSGRTRGIVSINLQSIHNPNSTCTIDTFILLRLTTKLPPYSPTTKSWPHITGLSLANLDFSNPDLINVIIGADNFGSIIKPGLIRGDISTPVAQQTIFGWILSGPISTNTSCT